jgi:hypothetical protein
MIALRRAQYAAASLGTDVPIARALLRRKLSGQRETLRRHPELPDAKGMERARDALDWFVGVAISLVQLVVGQVGFEVDASWHALVLQRCCATPYETPLTHPVSRGKAYILRPMTWRGGRG